MNRNPKQVTGSARKSDAIHQITSDPQKYFSSQARPPRLSKSAQQKSNEFGFRKNQ